MEYAEIEIFGHKYEVELDETKLDGYIYIEDENGKIILKEKIPEDV